MKKLILVLAILVVASPAFAVLDVNLVDLTGSNVQIRYTGADPCNLPRAFALVIDVNGGKADVCGVTGYKTGVSTSTSRGFGIYPATIVINGAGDVNDYGNPIASSGDPLPAGADQILPSNKLVLEFGSLYAPVHDGTNSPATDGNLCTLTVDCNGATGNVDIKMTGETTYRGGIVLENGTVVDVNKTLTYTACQPTCPLGLTLNQVFNKTICDPCLGANITVTTAMINMWNFLGQPCCWACNAQKCGNGNYTGGSKTRVDNVDVTDVKQSWLKLYTQPGYKPCSDFNLSGRVDNVDLVIIKTHYLKLPGSSACL